MASWLLRSRLGLVALLIVPSAIVVIATPGEACAHPAGASAVSAENQAEAQRHFRAAQEYYQQGAYSETIAELKMAVSLDPGAKDLYFNLGVVYEKVDDIDGALEHFRKYETFDLDANERARAEKFIRRLEGAKAQRKTTPVTPPPAPTTTAPAQVVTPPPPVVPPSPSHGRIDALTISSAAATVVSLGVGTAFGIAALTSQPKSDFTTGKDGSYADLEAASKSAHDKAVVADVAFVAAGAFAVTTAILYFGRTKDPAVNAEGPLVSRFAVTPLAHGGAMMLGGAF